MALLAYDLAEDGTATFREVLVDYYPEDGPDGLVVDVDGNLYVAVRDVTRPGINVYSPAREKNWRVFQPEWCRRMWRLAEVTRAKPCTSRQETPSTGFRS